eukprot:1781760-Rhodomonas_salina.1
MVAPTQAISAHSRAQGCAALSSGMSAPGLARAGRVPRLDALGSTAPILPCCRSTTFGADGGRAATRCCTPGSEG